MKEKYIYPCVVYEEDGVYYANFKDFDACFTDGENIEEVIINAKDVLEGTIFSLLKNNLEVPEPTLTKPNLENNEFLVYIDIWLTPIIDKVKIKHWTSHDWHPTSARATSVLTHLIKRKRICIVKRNF